MKVLVITGGKIDVDFALDFLTNHLFDEVIAVDGGLEKVKILEEKLSDQGIGFRLTHIVGDFDTVREDVLAEYQNRKDITIHAYQPEKDYTDTDIALKLAMKLAGKSGEIVMLGATGTRLDHVLANLQMLKLPMEAGIDCSVIDANNRIRMIEHHYTVKEKYSRYISLIPVSASLKGVTLRGFKYPLDHHDVYLGQSLCVSNEIESLPAEIEIEEGAALLIESED